jgi:hypothetical protein
MWSHVHTDEQWPRRRFGRRQIAELPPISVLVTEHRTHQLRCPDCRARTSPSLSTSGETLTIGELLTLRARTENAGDVGVQCRSLERRECKNDHAVGGVAGASFVRPAVEPVDVVVWVRRDDADLWAKRLAATPSRPAPGRVTMQLIRDPFVLSLAGDRGGDPGRRSGEHYLDCRSAGEHALEAADAIRVEMRW